MKNYTLETFNLNASQNLKIQEFLSLLKNCNTKANLVGKSTLIDPKNSHILDSIQISRYIKNRKLKIVDLGTGAGIPGIVLYIYGYFNMFLIDSNIKKITFLKKVAKDLNLSFNIIYSRIENFKNNKFDIIVSRALAKLDKLLFYSSFLSHKNTKLIFLKGMKIDQEINEAKYRWNFTYSLEQSLSDPRGKLVIISNFKKND